MMASHEGQIASMGRIVTDIYNSINNMNVGQISRVQQQQNQLQPVISNGTYHFWPGDDKMHRVPYGFKWPTGRNTIIMWNYWFFGDVDKNIGAYKNILSNEDLTTKECKSRRSRTVKVVDALIKIAADAGRILNQRQISVENSTAIFDFAFVELMRRIYPNQPDKRGSDLVLCAVYERMRKVERPAP
jgi:hypothetical protein